MTPKERAEEALKKDTEAKKGQPATDKVEVQKEELLQMSEISIWLDNYDDIFSDFDPRPYSQRALSDDFLNEAKRASREKTTGQVELKFLIPKDLQKTEEEKTIKRRLHDHFKRHTSETEKEIKRFTVKGISLLLLGMMSMMFTVYIFSTGITSLEYLVVFLEPTGWFMAWYGFDALFYQAAEHKPEKEFYEKMSKSQITFLPY